jgi:hypothetical protein
MLLDLCSLLDRCAPCGQELLGEEAVAYQATQKELLQELV